MITLPKSWSDWEITDMIGEGSFAAVYRARRRDDHSFESAIKVIPIPRDEAEAEELTGQGFTQDQSRQFFDETVEEFIREVRIMEQFKGTQNIVSIEDYKAEPKESGVGSNLFIRMELLVPLDRYLSGREVTERDAAQLGADVCSALSLCMSRGLIHRDVKPENIFVNDRIEGHVFYKLGDFGIARTMEQRTGGMSARGTPNYIAPEAALGKPYDTRADIYSLGLTMYRLLNNNRLPFFPRTALYTPAAKREALMRRLNGETPEPPANASPEMAKVILKACSFRPEDRYQTADEMKEAILKALDADQKPAPAESPDMPEPRAPETAAREKKRRVRLPAVLLAAALVLALGAGGIMLSRKQRQDAEPTGTAGVSETGASALQTLRPQKTDGAAADAGNRYDPLGSDEESRRFFETLREKLYRADGAPVVFVPFSLEELSELPALGIPALQYEERNGQGFVIIRDGTAGWTLNGEPMAAPEKMLEDVSALPALGTARELCLEQKGTDFLARFVYACEPSGESRCVLADLAFWPEDRTTLVFRLTEQNGAKRVRIETWISDRETGEELLFCTAGYLDGLPEGYRIECGENYWNLDANDSCSDGSVTDAQAVPADRVYRLRSPQQAAQPVSLPKEVTFPMGEVQQLRPDRDGELFHTEEPAK